MKNTKKISKKKYHLEIGIWTGAWYIGGGKEIEYTLEHRSNKLKWLEDKLKGYIDWYGSNKIGYARIYDNSGELIAELLNETLCY